MDNISDTQSHVLVIEEPASRKTILLEEAAYSFGRDASNSVVLFSKKVSRHHATLLRRTDQSNNCYSFWIIDGNLEGERSKNGVFVNNKRSLVQSLKHDDVIIMADVKLTYYITNNLSEFLMIQAGDYNHKTTRKEEASEIIESSKETYVKEVTSIGENEMVKLASFPELSPNPIVEIDWQGRITYLNPAALATFPNIENIQITHPIIAGLTQNIQQRQGSLFVREVKIDTDCFEQYVHYLPEEKLIRSYIFNFTKRKGIEASLRESKKIYHQLVKQSSDGICIIDYEHQTVIEANNSYCELLGYTPEESLNLKLKDIWVLEDSEIKQNVRNTISNKLDRVLALPHKKKDGEIIQLETNLSFTNFGKRQIICCSVTKVNGSTEVTEGNLLYHKITNLASKALFDELLATNLANCKRNKQLTALLMVEIDHYEQIESSLGVEKIELLLQDISKRLRSCLRAGDSIAHPQDNQFYVLLVDFNQIKDSAKVAQRLLDVLRPPFEIDKQRIYISVGIGISMYENQDQPTLFNHAQIALNRSHQKGNNNYQFYQANLTTEINRVLRLETLLEEAIAKEEFLLYYQPRVNIKTQKITAVEALLRWQHPEFGLITPERFLPIAEEVGLMIPIGEWVIKKACQQNRNWQKLGVESFPIAVNISAKQFQQPDLVARIAEILSTIGLDSKYLELELTEKVIMVNLDYSRQKLAELRNLGLCLALDDFNPMSSSVGYLRQFPLDSIKIHQSFIAQLTETSSSLNAVASTITMGKEFNLKVIVEGVETTEQLKLLKSLNCEQMQGYLFSRAVSHENIYEFLTNPESLIIG